MARLFGEGIAALVGPISGSRDSAELRNMSVRPPQPGLHFIAGRLPQCRIYSKTSRCRSRRVKWAVSG